MHMPVQLLVDALAGFARQRLVYRVAVGASPLVLVWCARVGQMDNAAEVDCAPC
jgi:hypothetical protein